MALNRSDVALIIAILTGALIGVYAFDVTDLQSWPVYAESWATAPEGGEDHGEMGTAIFETWAVPFEVLSLLLLVGLVGAIAVATKGRRNGGGP